MGELLKLQNIGKVVEEQLNEVGIFTEEELKEIGSKEAWIRIRQIDDSACIHRLMGLEGAVQGIKKSLLSEEKKADLREFYKLNNATAVKELRNHLDEVHTTELGIDRIKKNLDLDVDDVVEWCKNRIMSSEAVITRQGKNWYIDVGECMLTVNAYSYTIITGHKR